ncbi:nucleotidyltransferase family protein [Thermococcus sp.]|uniref:nucleotidyltransferase family protein n=1 Tax=Thermococcus sp. TaxID=35749 RepID=UPI0025CF25B0|nr:nucleotidyltransferase domain-containing protein [Thermococcus sp.]
MRPFAENIRKSLENASGRSIAISGSYARGEETELSDVDILIEFARPVGWEIVDLRTTWKNSSACLWT